MNGKWFGLGKEFVAANLYLISPDPVAYTEEGDLKTYRKPNADDSLSSIRSRCLPAAKRRGRNSLNKRIKNS